MCHLGGWALGFSSALILIAHSGRSQLLCHKELEQPYGEARMARNGTSS